MLQIVYMLFEHRNNTGFSGETDNRRTSDSSSGKPVHGRESVSLGQSVRSSSLVQKHLLNTQTAHMAVIHICAENRAEAVSSIKNGQRAERQERPDKLKPKLQLNTEHPVECHHSFVFVWMSSLTVGSCSYSHNMQLIFQKILYTQLSHSQHTRLLLLFHSEVEKRMN